MGSDDIPTLSHDVRRKCLRPLLSQGCGAGQYAKGMTEECDDYDEGAQTELDEEDVAGAGPCVYSEEEGDDFAEMFQPSFVSTPIRSSQRGSAGLDYQLAQQDMQMTPETARRQRTSRSPSSHRRQQLTPILVETYRKVSVETTPHGTVKKVKRRLEYSDTPEEPAWTYDEVSPIHPHVSGRGYGRQRRTRREGMGARRALAFDSPDEQEDQQAEYEATTPPRAARRSSTRTSNVDSVEQSEQRADGSVHRTRSVRTVENVGNLVTARAARPESTATRWRTTAAPQQVAEAARRARRDAPQTQRSSQQ
ncbi:hypothetical protein ANN_10976 [Periplaneta americana]|uniref:Uncharacterized protein n=1 Tax=Periplaneta americana TaxID=6978 RepID=A0ABQ8T4Y6_PERAM|nr:hypothetical protein ANN_10976 [Periplaneta americana]